MIDSRDGDTGIIDTRELPREERNAERSDLESCRKREVPIEFRRTVTISEGA